MSMIVLALQVQRLPSRIETHKSSVITDHDYYYQFIVVPVVTPIDPFKVTLAEYTALWAFGRVRHTRSQQLRCGGGELGLVLYQCLQTMDHSLAQRAIHCQAEAYMLA